jgi:arylsulfatase A-like enzyme
VPTVYIEDGKVVGLDPNDPIEVNYQKNFKGEPTGLENPELLTMNWHHGHNSSIVNGIPRIGFMRGGEAAKWSDVDMADHFLNGIQKYIKSHKGKPFFLYYPMQQPHVPRTPHPRFEGLSELGPRGDAIVEADWCLGELKKTLEAEGIIDNTLIIFSSDNGPVLNDGYYDDSDVKNGDHLPSGPLRGGKYSLFEAGTRVPFFTYWKGKIKPGVSDSMVSQLDLLSSLAQLVGSKVRTGDSLPLLELLMGQSDEGRDEMVIEATSRTAYKRGDWVMIPPYEGPALNDKVQIELGNASDFQLYNLAEDIEQQNNLAALKPDKLQEMLTAFEAIRGDDYGKIEKLELK